MIKLTKELKLNLKNIPTRLMMMWMMSLNALLVSKFGLSRDILMFDYSVLFVNEGLMTKIISFFANFVLKT